MAKPRKLTAKQEAFAQHYALHRNAADAYRSAYASKGEPQTCQVNGAKLLKNTMVALRIEELTARVAEIAEEKFDITAERILQELAAVAFYNAEDYFDWGTYERPRLRKDKESGRYEAVILDDGKMLTESIPFAQPKGANELSRHQKRAVLGVGETISKTGDRIIEMKMGDKIGALKLLGMNQGLFKTINEHQGKGGSAINLLISSAEAAL